MKSIKLLVFCFLLVSLSSCTIFRKTYKPSGFKNPASGEYSYIDTLISTDGYFTKKRDGSNALSFMFLDNGVLCFTYQNPIEQFSMKFQDDRSYCGSYYIDNGYIIANTISDDGLMVGVTTKHYVMEILDENTIFINSPDYSKGYYYFHKLENRFEKTSDIDCWVLNKKWFWKKGYGKNK